MVYMLFPKMCRFQVSDFPSGIPLVHGTWATAREVQWRKRRRRLVVAAVASQPADENPMVYDRFTNFWRTIWEVFSHVQTELPIELYLWCKDYSIFMFINHDDELPFLFICVYDRITKVLLHSHID